VKNEELPTSYDNLARIHVVAMPLACSLYIYMFPLTIETYNLYDFCYCVV